MYLHNTTGNLLNNTNEIGPVLDLYGMLKEFNYFDNSSVYYVFKSWKYFGLEILLTLSIYNT